MTTTTIHLITFFQSIASLIDSTHAQFRGQHLKSAYICARLAKVLKISPTDTLNLVLASLVRDIGTLTLQERLTIQPFSSQKTQQHCTVAYWILNQDSDLSSIAQIILYHHHPFTHEFASNVDAKIQQLSQILHIADRMACAINPDQLAVLSASPVLSMVAENSGQLFNPELCSAIQTLGNNEAFWLDMDLSNISRALALHLPDDAPVDLNYFERIALVFRYFIDFRSEFTIAHTAGVTAIAEKLAEMAHFSAEDIQKIRIAAYLHDIGKYAVPAEILEKPVALSSEEFEVVRATPYYTYWCLAGLGHEIQTWSGHHHERLNGSGYPFGIKGDAIELGAQIIGLADMFSAMIERRPYRDGKTSTEALQILQNDAEQGKISADLLGIAKANESELAAYHAQKIDEAFDVYNEYIKSLMYAQSK